jgi:hypothetical protein
MLRHSTTTCATLDIVGVVSHAYFSYAILQTMPKTQKQTGCAQDAPTLMPHARGLPHAIISVPMLVFYAPTLF